MLAPAPSAAIMNSGWAELSCESESDWAFFCALASSERAICSSVKSERKADCTSSIAAGNGCAGARRYSGTTVRLNALFARVAQKLR